MCCLFEVCPCTPAAHCEWGDIQQSMCSPGYSCYMLKHCSSPASYAELRCCCANCHHTHTTCRTLSQPQVAYDDVEKVAYLIGGKDIYVIDLSQKALLEDGEAAATPRDLPRLKNLTQPTTVNDVAFCGDYLAVSANGATKVLPGSVTIFRRYAQGFWGWFSYS